MDRRPALPRAHIADILAPLTGKSLAGAIWRMTEPVEERRHDLALRARIDAAGGLEAWADLPHDVRTEQALEDALPVPPQPRCTACGQDTHFACTGCKQWVCFGFVCKCGCSS